MTARKKPVDFTALDVARLERDIAEARAATTAYAARVRKEPLEAFHWIADAVVHAAHLDVFESVLAAIRKRTSETHVRTFVADAIRRMSSRGAVRSTAPLDLVMHAETLRAWTQIADRLKGEC